MLKATAGWGAIMFSGGIQEKPHKPVVLHCRLQIRWLYSFLSDILLAVSSVRKHILTSGFAYWHTGHARNNNDISHHQQCRNTAATLILWSSINSGSPPRWWQKTTSALLPCLKKAAAAAAAAGKKQTACRTMGVSYNTISKSIRLPVVFLCAVADSLRGEVNQSNFWELRIYPSLCVIHCLVCDSTPIQPFGNVVWYLEYTKWL